MHRFGADRGSPAPDLRGNQPGDPTLAATSATKATPPRPEVSGIVSLKFSSSVYAATGSSTMSRVRAGSTLTPGPIVVANTTDRM